MCINDVKKYNPEANYTAEENTILKAMAQCPRDWRVAFEVRELDLEERLLRIGYVQCPGAYARGCLALIPAGSGAMLCQFCQGTIRLNMTGRRA